MQRLICLTLFLFLPAAPLHAQSVRYELGQRLRAFERELNKPGRMARRKEAVEPLVQATPAFFRGQLAEAAGLLDRARLTLAGSEKPSEAATWANSLVVKPQTRFLDTSANGLEVRVETFYRVAAERPAKVEVRLALIGVTGKAVAARTFPLAGLPATLNLALKDVREGDHALRSEILVGGSVQAAWEQTLSLADRLADRLAGLKKGLDEIRQKPASTAKATLARLVTILSDLAGKQTLETNYPAARLLDEGESVLAAVRAGKPYYGADRPGQFWLTLASKEGTDPVRVQVPEAAKKGKPLPLVVAMHGAGGSENMFFDGYGDGLVAKACAKRGWILVTTRAPFLPFGNGPDVPRVIAALAKIYPVDAKRVYLVGHSMGAAQAVANAGRRPELFRAVAALAGGGGFKASDGLKNVRFFVGVGDRDFAGSGAKSLHRALVKAGVKKAAFRNFADTEHITAVQVALPDVFKFFEEE